MQQQALITALPDGKICDFIDGTIRNDTPEEYVRQNIERRLVKELGYKPERIAVEFTVKVGSARKRVDIAIFPEGKAHLQENIDIIIECKHDKVKPSDQKDGEDQLKTYLSSCPNAWWGMWTNGRYKSVFRKAEIEGRIGWEEPNDIPAHDGNVDDVDRPSRASLVRSTDDNLLFSFPNLPRPHLRHRRYAEATGVFRVAESHLLQDLGRAEHTPPLEFYATAKEKAQSRRTAYGQATHRQDFRERSRSDTPPYSIRMMRSSWNRGHSPT